MHKEIPYVFTRVEKCHAFLLKGKRAEGKAKELELFVDYYKAM